MQEFISISLLIVLAAISPGPDFALVTKNSLLYSRKMGIITALGVFISLLIHVAYCLFGLALIIAESPFAFDIIKCLGAAYLIYLGISSLLAKEPSAIQANNFHNTVSERQIFMQGFLCNLLNPKAILFLLAFFTLVIQPEDNLATEIIYGIEIALVHLIWFSLISFLLTITYVKNNLHHFQFYIVKAMGILLIGFGIKIITLLF